MLPHRYRPSAAARVRYWLMFLPVLVAAVALIGHMILDDDTPDLVWELSLLGAVLLLAPVFRAVAVLSTVVTEEGITVRGMVRSRTTRWADIQDLRLERLPGTEAAPQGIIALYDDRGRGRVLPYAYNANRDIRGALQQLRDLWVERRGPGWTPRGQR